jgi:drug/metabolite transporter (DMT)-like permease
MSNPTSSAAVRPAIAFLLLTVAAMLWGSNITIGRAVQADIPPIALTFWRNCCALTAIAFLARGHWHEIWPAFRAQKAVFLIGGILGVGCFNSLLYTAVHTTTAINAALSMSLTPVIVPLLAFFILNDRFSWRKGVGVAISFAGIGVILTRADWAVLTGLVFRPGDLIMLAATTAWSVYTVLVKKRAAEMHPMAFLTTMLLVAVIALLPAYVIESLTVRPMPTTPAALGTALYVGLFPTAFALILFNRAVDSVGPATAGHFQHLVPVFATLWAILFIGETLHLYHAAGAVLIAAGIYCATSSAKTR